MAWQCPHCLCAIAAELLAAERSAQVHCPECGHVFCREELVTTVSGLSTHEGRRHEDGSTGAPPFLGHFGHYRAVALIGQGGMGRVYRARHIHTRAEIAVKTVRAPTQSFLRHIRREILALSRARHPGLVQFVATGLNDSVPWYGMELIEGDTLHDRMKGVAVADVGFLSLMARVCSALAYLHGEGVVHRDLKPRNIVLRPDGTPVIVDFGVASRFGAVGRETVEASSHAEGTPPYMAPEQIRGEYVDARADLFAVGCILYKGVTGRLPFGAPPTGTTIPELVEELPVLPSQLAGQIAPALEALILRLLARNARDRLGHAKDVVTVLVELGADAGDWLIRWPAQDYLYRPRFVGREPVLELLQTYLARAHAGENRCVLVRGESGVGKTRLILEMARLLENSGTKVFCGDCLPVNVATEGGGPQVRAPLLHPFRPLLHAVADVCLESGRAEFDRLVGPRARLLAIIEPRLAGLAGADAAPPGDDPAADRRLQLLDALGQTLVALARRAPFVVFLDDLQWADELTLKFLDLLHAGAWEGRGFAVVASCRSEDEYQISSRFGFRTSHMPGHLLAAAPQVRLDRFDEAMVGQIVRDMLGVHELDERFVSFLAQRSEGNPFFIAEYLRTAVAEGLLRRDQAGRWRLSALADADLGAMRDAPGTARNYLELPASLRQLVARRLEGLPPRARTVVELGAVLGREVEGDLLQAVSALEEAEFFEAVNVLVTRQVFEERDANRFRFDHDKLREIAYEQIPAERRRQLHWQAAQAIELRYAGAADFAQFYGSLADHWRRSLKDRLAEPERTAKAVDYLEKAAQHSLFSGLHRQAVEFGLEAARLLGVELPTDPAQVGPMLAREMADIDRLMAGRAPAELLHLSDAATLDRTRAIAILLSIQPAAYISHQLELFSLLAATNMGLILRHGQTPLSPCVFSMFATVTRLLSDDCPRALAFSELALALDQRQGGQFTSAVTFVHTWFINHWMNALHDNLPISLHGSRAGFQSGDILYGCYHLAGYMVYLSAGGAPLSEVIEAAQRHHEQIGSRIGYAAFHCLLERQFALALAGRTVAPLSLTSEQWDETRDLETICRTDSYNQMAYYFLARLRLEYYYRNYPAALECAARLLPLRTAFQGQVAEVDYCFFHALALIAHTDSLTGEERSRQQALAQDILARLERWAEHCPANFRHKALLVQAELTRVQGPAEEAGPLYDAAARAAFESRYLHHAALAQELAGSYHCRSGDRQRGRRYLEEACRTYQQWGAIAKVKDVSQRLAAV